MPLVTRPLNTSPVVQRQKSILDYNRIPNEACCGYNCHTF